MYPIITISRCFSTTLLIFTISALFTFSSVSSSNAAPTPPHTQLIKVVDSQAATSDDNKATFPDTQQTVSSTSDQAPEPNLLTQGPGSFISSLIQSLSQKADSSDSGIKKLLTGIPNLIPDLYKVFLSL